MKTLGKIFGAHIACLAVAMFLIALVVKFTLGDWGVLVAVALPLTAITAWMWMAEPKKNSHVVLSLISLAVSGLLAYYFVWIGESSAVVMAAICMVLVAIPASLGNYRLLAGMGAMLASIIGSDLGFIVTGDVIPGDEMWVEAICPISYLVIMGILFFKMKKKVPDWIKNGPEAI